MYIQFVGYRCVKSQFLTEGCQSVQTLWKHYTVKYFGGKYLFINNIQKFINI
jgi:hypothetical protein